MEEKHYSLQSSTGYWVTRLARVIEADLEARLKKHNVTRASSAVLIAIKHHDATTPAALASFIGIDRAAITRHLNRIEEQGLIIRDRSPSDGRSVNLKLTSKGERLIPELADQSRATNEKFTTGLTESENDTVQALIRRMLANSDDVVPGL